MDDLFQRIGSSLAGFGRRVAEWVRQAPGHIATFLKKPGTRKAIWQVLLFLTLFTLAVLALIWLILMAVKALAYIWEYYGVYIVGILTCIGLAVKWRDDKRREGQEQRRRELAEMNKRAQPNYIYLRNFLYSVLTPHFCTLTGLSQPLTANTLTENPPFEADGETGGMFFFYRVDKESLEPLQRGTSHVSNLLLSVISQRMETTGIEGICPATSDPLRTVISIHSVEDLGSRVRITLVFQNPAYERFKEKQGVPGPISSGLTEHIR
ncbi:MAG: hypothetical protein E7244_24805 [Enterocloster citroniae]|nr:hypothetical protein [Enterocloster citroniae]